MIVQALHVCHLSHNITKLLCQSTSQQATASHLGFPVVYSLLLDFDFRVFLPIKSLSLPNISP